MLKLHCDTCKFSCKKIYYFDNHNNKLHNNKANSKTSYSQIGQDINVVRYYKRKNNGFFVDIGANDGLTLSNTYLLEKEYNWDGICVEPLIDAYDKLKNFRNVLCINKAVYKTSNMVLDFAESNLFSGINKHITENIKYIQNNYPFILFRRHKQINYAFIISFYLVKNYQYIIICQKK